MPARSLYIAENVLMNALSPIVSRVRGPGALGMDADLTRVRHTLSWLAECLGPVGISADGRRALELGPGRTCEILAALVLAGARSGLGLDTHVRVPRSYASPERYHEVCEMLTASGSDFLHAVGASPPGVERRCRQLTGGQFPLKFARYDGKSIPLADDSIDLIVSKSVLEHVRADDVEQLLSEMRRVLSPDGVMVHIIDLRDHMQIDGEAAVIGDWLDALTYPDWLFQAMFSNRPVSINRLRADRWEQLFTNYGFRTLFMREYRLPLPDGFARRRLATRWRSLDERALSVAQLAVVLQ